MTITIIVSYLLIGWLLTSAIVKIDSKIDSGEPIPNGLILICHVVWPIAGLICFTVVAIIWYGESNKNFGRYYRKMYGG